MTTSDLTPETAKPHEPRRQRGGIRKWFEEDLSSEFKLRLPGIEIKAKSRKGAVLIVVVVLLLLLCPVAATWAITTIRARTAVPPPKIAVILPNWELAAEGPFYQDGAVQKAGFDKAIADTDQLTTRLEVVFEKMGPKDSPDTLLARMRALHAEGAVFFVMTMSTKIGAVQDGFIRWRREFSPGDSRTPVLIATVASAPDIADIRNGIVRWYIRSEEESELVAEFAVWRQQAEHACVFFITRTPGEADDRYGKRGMEVFRDRFIALGGRVECRAVTADTASTEVAALLQQIQKTSNGAPTHVCAFVVGYGKMVPATLNALISSGFDGPIACTSTLTEPDWQPLDRRDDARIFTVLPRTERPHDGLDPADRNVVYFFSKLALARIRTWTAADRDSSRFLSRWGTEKDPYLREEYLMNGDVAVQLEVVGADRWRAATP